MTAWSLVAICATLGAAISTHALAAPEPANCKLIRIDEWAVKPEIPTPTLYGLINGQPIRVLLDTGLGLSEGALLERAAARRLRIPVKPYAGAEFAGLGGETQASIGFIHEIKIGQATRKSWQVMVGGVDHGHEGVFILGNGFFSNLELELDLANDAVRLFQSKDCRGAPLAYWAKEPAGEVRISMDRGHATVPVSINGRRINAVLDTGANTTILDSAVAARLGITPDTPGTTLGRCLRGFGPQGVDSWVGQFESFAIGNETIRNPKIYFADLQKDTPVVTIFRIRKYRLPDLIIGADFLRAHRVLISQPHSKVFFTYEGGTVFPTKPGRGCKTS